MKLGIAMFPADFAMRPDELARAVEQRGFESLFLPEHTHIPATASTRALMEKAMGGDVGAYFFHTYDLFVALTYAAAATRTLRLGTGICLMAQRDPIATAKAVASLDVLSGGRVLFGVGAGWIPEEPKNHGTDPAKRWTVMAERVQAMRRIWTEDVAEYSGEVVRFGPLMSWPKPQQRPHPPILVGGEGRGAERRVLELGGEWMPHAGMPLEDLARRIAALRQSARDAGRTDDLPVTLFGAQPNAVALRALSEIGVNRAVLYAQPADADTVIRFLDEAAAWISVVSS
jgi:probable F420-dependent oxidoreductase